MKKIRLMLLFIIVVILVATCGSTSDNNQDENDNNTETSASSSYYIIKSFSNSGMSKGDVFTDLVWNDEDQNEVSLLGLGANCYVIDIWATWCGPCRQEIPHLNDLQDEFEEQGLVVVGISIDDNPAALPPFIESMNIDYIVLQTSDNDLINMILSPGGGAIPQTYILDKQGKIIEHYVGYAPSIGEQIHNQVSDLLK